MARQPENAQAGPSRRKWAGSDSEDEPASSPRRPTKRRKTPAEGEDEDDFDDLDDLNSDSDGGIEVLGQPIGNGHANGHANGDEDDEGLSDAPLGEDDMLNGDDVDMVAEGDRGRVEFRPEYQRDKDGYVAGSIVRIKCKGFMTYDMVEFTPGPNLNMILGPNGTGKSSIAAAIAIGLGFPAKVMGRANDIKAYVKQGTEQATTEIELKGSKKTKMKNIIIKRRFTRDNDTSEWFINGVSCPKREVTQTVEGMGIQANNLCSFLPQDKVAEFARMNPVTVLRETMRAAGDPRLAQWHESLCELGDKARSIEMDLEGATQKRDNLQALVDRDEPDVQAFKERERNEFERDVNEVMLVVKDHENLTARHEQLRLDKKTLIEVRSALTQRRKPILTLHEKQKEKSIKADVRVTKGDADLAGYNNQFKKANRKIDEISAKSEDVSRKLGEIRKEMQKLEQEKERQRTRIRNAETAREQPKAKIAAEYQEKNKAVREFSDKQRQAERDFFEAQQEHQDGDRELRTVQQKIEAHSKHLASLQSLEAQREDDARKLDPSIGYMLDWIEKNQMKLEGPVHKPPMISVNVREKTLAWQIEACTNMNHRKTFICETKADYTTLTALNNRQMGNGNDRVRCNVTYQSVTNETVNPRRPCSPAQLQAIGLDGFAIDYVEAAPAVIAFLSDKCGMHRSAVSSKDGGNIDSDAVARLGVQMYITKTDVNRIIRSNYGLRQNMTVSSGPQPARAFNKIVDTEQIKKVADAKAKLTTQMRDSEAPQRQLKLKMDKAKEASMKFKSQMDEVAAQARELKKTLDKIQQAEVDIDVATAALAELEKRPNGEARKAKLKAEKLAIVKGLLQPITDHQATSADALETLDELVKHGLAGRQAQVNVEAIESKLKHRDGEVIANDKDLKAVADEIIEVALNHTQASRTIQAMLDAKPVEVKEAVEERRRHPIDQQAIRLKLQDIQAQLLQSDGVDRAILTRFEKNKTTLEEFIALVTKRERDLGIIKRKIAKILHNFDPALDSLVAVVSEKFGAAFEKIGCSGEVRVDRVPGDFRTWGIQILVSYRNEEGLALLTSNRQSGGERSLATVTYLMSLSEMARTPFSLVDEINQGMDKKYERAVHNQLVGVTCAEDAGQYFLITPKLLAGLHYHPKMKILIVNNGMNLPDTSGKTVGFGRLGDRLKQYQRHVAAH